MKKETEDNIVRLEKEVGGWCTLSKAITLCDFVVYDKPQVCVEIGVFAGRSALAIALGLKENNKGYLIAIDPWEVTAAIEYENEANVDWWEKQDYETIYKNFLADINKFNVIPYVKVVRQRSEDLQWEENLIADYIHCDGNHSESTSCRDVDLWMPRLKKGGLFIMDDANWPSTQTAVKMVESKCQELYRIIGEGTESRFYRKL